MRPFYSDLWLPLIVLLGSLAVLLGLYYAWAQWSVNRLVQHAFKQTANPLALGPDRSQPEQVAKPTAGSNTRGIVALDELTARPKSFAFKEESWPGYDAVPNAAALDTNDNALDTPDPMPHFNLRVEPTFAQFPQAIYPGTASESAGTRPTQSSPTQPPPETSQVTDTTTPATAHAETVLTLAPQTPKEQDAHERAPLHPVLQYIVRLSWEQSPPTHTIKDTFKSMPWSGDFKIQHYFDPQHNALEIGMFLVNRLTTVQAKDLTSFDRWARAIASTLKAKPLPQFHIQPCLIQIETAKNLLQDLDSVVNLRVQVPASQLDLFEQSLTAARFLPMQEHWVFETQHGKDRHGIWLERLWRAQNPSANSEHGNHATFQMAIDIPHLGLLDARKAYMRIRAVARASAAILQTDQGVHLSEGMLDRFAREINNRQEILTQENIEPGSDTAVALFKPRIVLQKDLYQS